MSRENTNAGCGWESLLLLMQEKRPTRLRRRL